MAKKRSWMPKAGGILSIVAGAIEILGGITAGIILTTLVDIPGLGAITGFPLVILGMWLLSAASSPLEKGYGGWLSPELFAHYCCPLSRSWAY